MVNFDVIFYHGNFLIKFMTFFLKIYFKLWKFSINKFSKSSFKMEKIGAMSQSSQLKKHYHKVFNWSEHWETVWMMFDSLRWWTFPYFRSTHIHFTTAGASKQTMTTLLSLSRSLRFCHDMTIISKKWWWLWWWWRWRWAKHVCLL